VLHEAGEKTREKGRQDGQRAQGIQQRDQGEPGDGPVSELREGEYQEDPRQDGQRGLRRGEPPRAGRLQFRSGFP